MSKYVKNGKNREIYFQFMMDICGIKDKEIDNEVWKCFISWEKDFDLKWLKTILNELVLRLNVPFLTKDQVIPLLKNYELILGVYTILLKFQKELLQDVKKLNKDEIDGK